MSVFFGDHFNRGALGARCAAGNPGGAALIIHMYNLHSAYHQAAAELRNIDPDVMQQPRFRNLLHRSP